MKSVGRQPLWSTRRLSKRLSVLKMVRSINSPLLDLSDYSYLTIAENIPLQIRKKRYLMLQQLLTVAGD